MRYAAMAMAVVLVAFALRLFRLAEMPMGFSFDEASNLIDAALIASDQLRPIYFPDTDHSVAREALFLYFQAFFVTVIGFEPLAARLASVFVGTLTVAAIYRLVLELFAGPDDKPARAAMALLSSAFLATLFWHLHMSRIALRAISLPLLEVLAFVFLWHALRQRKALHFALFGGFLGLSLYTYTASRILPLFALPILVWGLWQQSITQRERLTHLAAALGALSVAVLPLVYVSVMWPDLVWEHMVVQVAMEEDVGRAILSRAIATAGMFSLGGDAIQQYNLVGRPVFEAVTALLFHSGLAIGLTSLFGRWRRRLIPGNQHDPLGPLPYAFLILWLVATLIPCVVSGQAPHFLHAIGAAPAAAIFAALPLWVLAEALQRKVARWPSHRWLLVLGALAIAWHGTFSVRDYFWDYATRPETYGDFDGAIIDMSHYVKKRSQEVRVYVDPYFRDRPTASVFLRGVPLEAFDPRRAAVFPEADAEYLFFTYNQDIGHFSLFLPESVKADHVCDTLGRPVLLSFRLTAEETRQVRETVLGQGANEDKPHFSPVEAHQYVFADQFALRSYALREQDRWLAPDAPLTPGTPLDVILGWVALRRPDANYTISVKVVDDQGRTWAHEDSPPGGASYAMEGWRTDEVILDRHPLLLPHDMPAGRYWIQVGAYESPHLATIPVVYGGQSPGPWAVLDLGIVEVRRP